MFGKVVLGVDADLFEQALADGEGAGRQAVRPRAVGATSCGHWSTRFKAIVADAGRGLSRRSVGAAPAGGAGRLPLLEHAARHGLPAIQPHFGRLSARRSTCRRWSSATSARTAAPAWPSPAIRPPASRSSSANIWSMRRARTSSPASARRSPVSAMADDPVVRARVRASCCEIARAARSALPRHAGSRVHGRARAALDAADPDRQADGAGGGPDRGRYGRTRG